MVLPRTPATPRLASSAAHELLVPPDLGALKPAERRCAAFWAEVSWSKPWCGRCWASPAWASVKRPRSVSRGRPRPRRRFRRRPSGGASLAGSRGRGVWPRGALQVRSPRGCLVRHWARLAIAVCETGLTPALLDAPGLGKDKRSTATKPALCRCATGQLLREAAQRGTDMATKRVTTSKPRTPALPRRLAKRPPS